MARVKRGVVAGRRHKKILKKAKGYFNARRKVFRTAKQAVIKAGQYAYRGRREKKREFKSALDCAYQRRGALVRYDIQHLDRWFEQGGIGHRPQGIGRLGSARYARFCGHRGESEGKPPGKTERCSLIKTCGIARTSTMRPLAQRPTVRAIS